MECALFFIIQGPSWEWGSPRHPSSPGGFWIEHLTDGALKYKTRFTQASRSFPMCQTGDSIRWSPTKTICLWSLTLIPPQGSGRGFSNIQPAANDVAFSPVSFSICFDIERWETNCLRLTRCRRQRWRTRGRTSTWPSFRTGEQKINDFC